MRKNWLIDRRTMLKGVGVAIALPLLETMGWAETPAKGGGRSPVRVGFFFIPNGVNLDAWKYRPDMTTPHPRTLMPLAPMMNDVLVINNLRHDTARGNGTDQGIGNHAIEAGTFLTGSMCLTENNESRCGISIDQVMAQKIGAYTSLPSLELGLEPTIQGHCETPKGCIFQSNISWRTPTSPMGKEITPQAVFDRMFAARKTKRPKTQQGPQVDAGQFAGKQEERSLQQSVLDSVLADVKDVRGNVSVNDQRKLDEYLDSIRALEQRIVHSEEAAREAVKQEAEKRPGNYSPLIQVNIPAGVPQLFAEHAKLMMDLVVLAFQSDTTRIVSFMFGNAGSDRIFRELGVTGFHHLTTHHGKDANKLEDIAKINVHHSEMFAYLLQKMKSINDGKGTLLDNSMLLYAGSLSDGDRHNHDDLPALLAGRGGGTIKPGRRLDAKGNMCDLFLGLAARAGCPLPQFGDSKGMLADLS
ncbi:MAG: DUF1552 domain-containing protein [Planctomycetes bacterium]|nr:DUF1552 domain-containing protein [Planctomycetota bacterium]